MVSVSSIDTGLYVVVLLNTLYYSGILLCFFIPLPSQNSILLWEFRFSHWCCWWL